MEASTQGFFVKLAKILRKPFYTEQLRWLTTFKRPLSHLKFNALK